MTFSPSPFPRSFLTHTCSHSQLPSYEDLLSLQKVLCSCAFRRCGGDDETVAAIGRGLDGLEGLFCALGFVWEEDGGRMWVEGFGVGVGWGDVRGLAWLGE